MQPRFRLFAGPNGSGKTHLFNFLRNQSYIHTEIYVNADSIEETLSERLQFNFNPYRVKVTESEFKKYALSSGVLTKINNKSFLEKLTIRSGILKIKIDKHELNSYIASIIATYLAEKLILTNQSFCFETVLSHPSKIKLIKLASKMGYKTNLYFIVTDDWKLNIERVKLRVKQGGHDVDAKTIEQRYFRSLKLFAKAAEFTNTTYLIDNSVNFNLIAILINGKLQKVSDNFPDWFKRYFNPFK